MTWSGERSFLILFEMTMMKTIPFTKMSGAGNDFIIIEKLPTEITPKNLAIRVCDRTNGIGADGIIIVEKSRKKDFNYKMRIINADGSEAEMCGNGARCFAAYVARHFKPSEKIFSFETLSGKILGQAKNEEAVVRLTDPKNFEPDIPILINGRELHVSHIDTGVPHTVIFVKDLDKIDVNTIGNQVRYHKTFEPCGTNVNFVEQLGLSLVNVRTYERGVEAETKACGTGTVAAALLSYMTQYPDISDTPKAQMRVKTSGGEILTVNFTIKNKIISNVWLKGSARFICQGEYYF